MLLRLTARFLISIVCMETARFFNRMGFSPFCLFFCPFFINTILTVEAKNGPLNEETLNGLKDVKCEQTFMKPFKLLKPHQRCLIESRADVTLFVFMVASSFAVSKGAHIPKTDVTSSPVTSLPSVHNMTSLNLTNTTEELHSNGKILSRCKVTLCYLWSRTRKCQILYYKWMNNLSEKKKLITDNFASNVKQNSNKNNISFNKNSAKHPWLSCPMYGLWRNETRKETEWLFKCTVIVKDRWWRFSMK